MSNKLISLIVPAYKQEKTIYKDITNIVQIMNKLKYKYEIIVVVDGFLDNTMENAKIIRSRNVHVVGYQHNHGKGYAVRFGMARAKGEVIVFLDAGMDIDPKNITVFITKFNQEHADVVIGSKLHPGSEINYPLQRKILSFGYRSLVKLFFGLNIRDTQVGFKLFKRKVLEDVLPRLLVKKYAFDIEMLAVANYLGYKRIFEAPVKINFNASSSITSKSFWRIIYHMLWDTAAVFYRLKILRYYDSSNRRKWRYDPELQMRINII